MGGNVQIWEVLMQFIAYIHFLAAIIAAKWAMELGFSQVQQLLWGFVGLIVGPLILLVLYVRAGWPST
jgi:hypothetical protein